MGTHRSKNIQYIVEKVTFLKNYINFILTFDTEKCVELNSEQHYRNHNFNVVITEKKLSSKK